MASEIGKIVHCKICGAPIEARGNRLYCPVCYNQNRRNAAQRSNARTKMEREQTKREEAKMKENNRIATSAAELNMRAKLSNLGGISYAQCAKGKAYNRRMLVLFRRNFSGSVHEKPSDIRCRSLGCGILPCGIFNNAQKQQSRQVYQGNGFGGQCG